MKRKNLSELLFGNTEAYSLSHKLFVFTSFYGIAVGIFGTIIDWYLKLGLLLVILPIIITILFSVFYYYSRFKYTYKYFVLPFIIISVVTVSLVWIINGGYDSANIYIFFNLFMISLILAEKESQRHAVLWIFFIFGSSLFFLHYYFPEVIVGYSDRESRFTDLYSTFLYCFFIMYFLVKFSVKSYESERSKVEEMNRHLEDANIELTELNKQVTEQNIELETLNSDLTERNYEISVEREKSDNLLLNILPESIAERLKEGETLIADHFDEASVIFIDMSKFTHLSSTQSPKKIVRFLNEIFTIFDKISEKYGIEKIKTIGDCYMAACGIPKAIENHYILISSMAFDVLDAIRNFEFEDLNEVNFRIGIDCGPIVAGVIGEKKFIYDLWGDTVNTAARMEEYGEPGKVHVSERFRNKFINSIADSKYTFVNRGEIMIKGKGLMNTFWMEKVIN